jgi:hypothetical protein
MNCIRVGAERGRIFAPEFNGDMPTFHNFFLPNTLHSCYVFIRIKQFAMEDGFKNFVYKDGLRFEVTPDGLFYAPEEHPEGKKHPCPDCRFCQWCADSRCSLCRCQDDRVSKKCQESNEFKMM